MFWMRVSGLPRSSGFTNPARRLTLGRRPKMCITRAIGFRFLPRARATRREPYAGCSAMTPAIFARSASSDGGFFGL
jgi:hypothetical protein